MVPHQFLCLALLVAQPADDPAVFINRELAKQWQAKKLTPADKTSDREFLRRASLDLIGRIPTLDEQHAFLKDPPEKRRRLLIDRLLQHQNFARHWANLWTDWLFLAAGETPPRQAVHGWLQNHFANNGSHKEFAQKLLTVHGSTRDEPAGHFFVQLRGEPILEKDQAKSGQYAMLPITGHVLRVFHGKRLQCVQCHDHPFDGEGRQEQFYGINAMFRQVEFTQANGVETIKDNPALNLSGLALYERRNGVQMATDPTFLDGRKIPRNFKGTRRAFLAEQLVKHPNFSRAHVGFVWAFLFGRGLTETADFDDMGEHNPVVQEKIMDRLAKDFVKHGHDPKALLRWICNSDAYGLQSIANKTNAGDAAAVHFSRMQARPLTRRQLAESLAVVLTGGDYRKRRDALVAELLQEFTPLSFASASTHLAGCDIEPINGEGDITTRRALWLMNSKTLHREIAAGDGRVAKVLAKPGRTVNGVHAHALPELFTIALGRSPSAKEQSSFSPPSVFVSPSCRNLVVTPAIWQPHYEDLFWSLLNSSEFALNH